jgi:agmatinase
MVAPATFQTASLFDLAYVRKTLTLKAQLDAHVDTWDVYFGERYTHGAMVRRAVEEGVLLSERSIQAGIRGSLYDSSEVSPAIDLGFSVVTADELRTLLPIEFGGMVRQRVGDAPVFISFDVDFLDPAYAPGTDGPEIGGFTSAEAAQLLRALAGIRVFGADVVEVSPAYDSPGQITALVAANVVWGILALAAIAVAGHPAGAGRLGGSLDGHKKAR